MSEKPFDQQLSEMIEQARREADLIAEGTQIIADQTERLRALWSAVEHGEQVRAAFFKRMAELRPGWDVAAIGTDGGARIIPPLPRDDLDQRTADLAERFVQARRPN